MENPSPFDRMAVRAHRDRAANGFGQADFLFRECAGRLIDRLDDVCREFSCLLDLGCHDGGLGAQLAARKGVTHVVQGDLSPAMARAARAQNGLATVACDEEFLPFGAECFDLVTSNLSLHWVNDLPGALTQICRALKPDGLFLAALLGGETLSALRAAWMDAEMGMENGASPRVSPFADVRDCGDLLVRAGFRLPVADVDTITVNFETPLHLMRDLRAMGEANAVAMRRKSFSRRGTLMEAAKRYPCAGDGDDRRITAGFQIIWLAAWAPGPGQPQALKPGSATARLADALEATEHPAGDTPPGGDK